MSSSTRTHRPTKAPTPKTTAAQAPQDPPVAWVWVDGSTADAWLGMNYRNRPMNEGAAGDIARDILDDNFDENGETVKFANEVQEDGATREILIDGQTRMRGVQIAAETNPQARAKMLVVRGLDAKVVLSVDAGRGRTYQHHLAMQGMAGSRTAASVIRRVINWRGGYFVPVASHRVRLTNHEIQTFHANNADAIEKAVLRGQSINRVHEISPTAAGAAMFLFDEIDAATAKTFCDEFKDWTDIGVPKHPIFALVQTLNKRAKDNDLNADSTLALMIKCWNLICEKDMTKSRIPLTDRDLTNKDFPKPIKPTWL